MDARNYSSHGTQRTKPTGKIVKRTKRNIPMEQRAHHVGKHSATAPNYRKQESRGRNKHASYGMKFNTRPTDYKIASTERRPEHQGIRSNRKPSPSSSDTDKTLDGYRIIVRNLPLDVTQNEIGELFEDIGDLLEWRLVRPGEGEVAYKNLQDAEAAIERYHNRLLDDQPMKCQLIKPHASEDRRSTGYMILVRNLPYYMTATDVQKLFSVFGELDASRVIRPGVAEVIYTKLEDAEVASDIYHKRRLDGQRIECLFIR